MLRTPVDAPVPERLAELQRELRALIAELRPDAVAVERVFFQTNVRTAMASAQASGLALAEAVDAGAVVAEYTPNQVKEAVAGWGGADKDEVERMVQALLGLDAAAPARRRRRRRRPRPLPPRPRPPPRPGRRRSRRSRRDDRLAAGHAAAPRRGAEVLVEVGGVGYRCTVAPATAVTVGDVGDEVFVHVHHHVREDAQTLYGFADRRRAGRASRRSSAPTASARPGPRHPVGPRARRRCARSSPTTTSPPCASCPASAARPPPASSSSSRAASTCPTSTAVATAVAADGRRCRRPRRRPRRGARGARRPRLRPRRGPRGPGRPARRRDADDAGALLLRRGPAGAGRARRVRRAIAVRDELLDPDPADRRREAADEVGLRPRRSTSSSARPSSRSTSASSSRPPAAGARPPTTSCSPARPASARPSLAGIVANEMGVRLHVTSGPAIERAGDLAALLTNLDEGDVLFIDEIHRLARAVEEVLYPAMEDFQLDIVLGKGPAARSHPPRPAPLHPGRRHHPHRAHHRPAPRPLRPRRPPRLLRAPPTSSASSCAPPASSASTTTADGAREIAGRARGTPRIANRLLRRVRDYAEVRADGVVDGDGRRRRPRRVRRRRARPRQGRPGRARGRCASASAAARSGLKTLAISVGEPDETVEDVYEPFLIQQGLLLRTPKGRVATPAAWAHLGLRRAGARDAGQPDLFGS